ncbi:ABC transporter permease [Bifidobacterium imperatoris]|nr:ABC transporter permease [Bifidobacterium imperatoris]
MRLTGMLGEAWRDLITGTSHACALAVGLACLITLLAGADGLTIMGIQRQTDGYVASGGSTWILEYPNHIDGAACDRLVSLDGVEAAGAVRQSDNKLVFAALPSTSVPLYDITPGAADVFMLSTTGTQWQYGKSRASGNTTASREGALLSREAAEPFQAQSGQSLALKDGRHLDVVGVFNWPDDGRKSGFSYAALTPVPADSSVSFSQCWVRAWPQTKNIESLLRLASDGSASATTADRPQIYKLNTTKGSELDSALLFTSRLTAFAPWIALAAALVLGFIATRIRKLEMASALHCGVPKTALITQILLETATWGIAGIILASPLLAWVWLNNTTAEAESLTDTLLRVPAAALLGVLLGAFLAVLLTRENHLLKYFKNR